MTANAPIVRTSPAEVAAAIAIADAADEAVRGAEAVLISIDATGFAAWAVLQRIERHKALELEAASRPADIARLTAELAWIESAVDQVFRLRYDS